MYYSKKTRQGVARHIFNQYYLRYTGSHIPLWTVEKEEVRLIAMISKLVDYNETAD